MPSRGEATELRLQARISAHRGVHGRVANARGTWDARESLVIELGDGRLRGFGEATPLPGHSPESFSEVQADLATLLRCPLLAPPPPASPPNGTDEPISGVAGWLAAQSASLVTPSGRFALETALIDYWSQRCAVPPWKLLGTRHPPSDIPVSRVLDPFDPALEARVERALAEGVRTIKLKLGRDFERELEALEALRKRWSTSTLRLRLDVNRSWSPDEVQPRLERLASVAPELLEEPSQSFDASAPSPVPLALDESLVGVAPDVAWLEGLRAVQVLVLKPMLLGGVARCLEWASAARAAGKRTIVSHLFDGPLALASCAQLACALGSLDRDPAEPGTPVPSAAVPPSGLAAGLSLHSGLQAWRARVPSPDYVRVERITPPTAPGLGTSFSRRLSVLAAAQEVPEAPALLLEDREISYAVLARGVRRVAAWLLRSEVSVASRAGAPVCFVAEPRLGALLLLYACIELGVTVLPLHPRSSTGEREQLIAELKPASCVGDEHFALFESWLADPAGSHELDAELPRELDEPDPEQDLAWLMTSGSTGQPRAVRLSRRAFLASADASGLRLGWRDDDRWLLALPFAHVGGLSVLTRCLIARRTVVVGSPRLGPEWAARLARQGVTLLSLVPAQLVRLLDEPSFQLPPSVRAVLVGGARAPAELIERARSRGVPALRTYGLTEACSQVATESPHAVSACRRDGYVGSVLPMLEVRIDTVGRIQLRGESLCSGYVGSEPSSELGDWFETSDQGALEGAQLYVFGRCDNVIVTGGENVAPEGVEAQLTSHPGVCEACVVGVPDPTWGQRLVVLVVLRDGTRIADVAAWAAEHLGAHRRPRAFVAVRALPHLPSGKLDRAAARRLALNDGDALER